MDGMFRGDFAIQHLRNALASYACTERTHHLQKNEDARNFRALCAAGGGNVSYYVREVEQFLETEFGKLAHSLLLHSRRRIEVARDPQTKLVTFLVSDAHTMKFCVEETISGTVPISIEEGVRNMFAFSQVWFGDDIVAHLEAEVMKIALSAPPLCKRCSCV